jgi:hypothetical protein
MKPSSWPVVVVVAAVGLLDVVTGGYLLFSPTPWLAHGPRTVWLNAPRVVNMSAESAALVVALFRRTGAFSLHAGMVTIAGAVLGRQNRKLMTGLLVLSMVDGLAFFLTDRAAFAGTPYLAAKQIIGTAWAFALAWHLVDGRRR